jgi:mycothiol synthase
VSVGNAVQLRTYRGEEDLPALVELWNAMAIADGIEERRSVDQMAAWYRTATPHLDPWQDLILAEEDGRVLAYGRHDWVDTSDGLREHRNWVVAGPPGRHLADAVFDALEARAAEAARLQGRIERERVFGSWAGDGQQWRHDALIRRGYAPVRWSWVMVRPSLDAIQQAPVPDGLEIRPFPRERTALRRLWAADAEAFADHWGGFDGSDAAFEAWLTEPEFDPSLFVVAFDGDEIAGAVWNLINASENAALGVRRGWLESVFVRRPWRRRGLAAALVARSLQVLHDRGMTSAILGVDAENPTGALGVYERAGFSVATRETVYRRPWASAGVEEPA